MSWRLAPISNRKQVAYAAILASVTTLLCVLVGAHKADALLSVQQTITPKDCQVQATEQADGTFYYSLPPRCGKLVLSAASANTAWSHSPFHVLAPLSIQPSAQLVQLLYEPQPTHLESEPNKQPLGGYVLVSQVGERYSFNLAEDLPGATDHVMQISSISDDGVVVQMWPGGRSIAVPYGQTRSYQDTELPVVDVAFNLMQLNADGSSTMRVQFPQEPWFRAPTNDSYSISIAGVLFVGMVSIALNVYVYDWLLMRRDAPSEDWWLVHHHEPFTD